MKTLANRITKSRENKGLTKAALAKLIRVSAPTVTDWESGTIQELKGENLLKLAQVLGVSAEWLRTGNNKHYIAEGVLPYETHENKGIPLISFVQAGKWPDIIDNCQADDVEDWLFALPCMNKRVFALRVTGDSMTSPYPGQRSYPSGTIIYVDPDRAVENGRRVVAKFTDTNESTFKQYREELGKKYLQPLNPQYEMIEIKNGIEVIGVVIHSFIPE